MADIMIDGFDHYGPPGFTCQAYEYALTTTPTSLVALLQSGEWTGVTWTATSTSSAEMQITAGLSSTGNALQFIGTTGAGVASLNLYRTLPANYATLVGGVRIRADGLGGSGMGFQLQDTTNVQCSVRLNETTGTFSVLSGSISGTVLGTSTVAVTTGATHYLEWEIGIGSSASYQLWLDGTSILSGTGNTRAGSANNYANLFSWVNNQSASGTSGFTIDDFYLFDTTGTVNNAPILTNPRIETDYATGDFQAQLTPGAMIIGNAYASTSSVNAPGANTLFLRRFKAPVGCTLNSVSCVPAATSSTVNFEPTVYSDNAGAPGTLLSSGSAVTGSSSGTTLTGALTTPQSLTQGSYYWIGFITDTSVTLQEVDTTTTGYKVAATYTSGAPSTPTGFTTGLPSWEVWGNCSGASANWPSQTDNPALAGLTYAYGSTVGEGDLYQFPALTTNPQNIYTVRVASYCSKTDTGTRTIDLNMKSGSASGTGSAPGLVPATSFGWLGSFFDVDPNTGLAWSYAGLNAAYAGPSIAS